MNQWPTVFFSLKDIDGLNFESAYGQLKAQISELYKKYAYLLEYGAIDPDDKQKFLDLKAGRAGEVQVSRALKDNSCLRFAVITGCLKIAKESIFTGTNNLTSGCTRWNMRNSIRRSGFSATVFHFLRSVVW